MLIVHLNSFVGFEKDQSHSNIGYQDSNDRAVYFKYSLYYFPLIQMHITP